MKTKVEVMVVEDNVFDQFIEACDKANRPNAALLAAAKFTKESHFESTGLTNLKN